MSANGLKLLMGDYSSDCEADDDDNTNAKTDLNVAVDVFVSELEEPAHASTADVPLVTSWTQCIDKTTGHPYYWHTDTKEVTWEVPVEYQAFLDQNSDVLAGSNAANMWTVCFTDGEETAQRYYVNEFTRVVSWDKPVGFVEPDETSAAVTLSTAINETADVPVSKNVIKRRKVQNREPKRENPFSKPTEAETLKIELISSFSAMSDTTSDEDESKSGDKSPKALKLVATDYNSDTDNNTAALDTTDGVLCAFLPKITRLPAAQQRSDSQPIDADEDMTIQPDRPTKKINTFASIITGGRSPEHSAKLSKDGLADSESSSQADQQTAADNALIVTMMKTQKRKRRIEFITNAPEVPAPETVPEIDVDQGQTKNMYANFKRSHVDFVANADSNNADKAQVLDTSDAQGADRFSSSSNAESVEFNNLKDIIEAKLKFLCEGRPEVPAVQAILIQLETLLEAFEEGALEATYINKWLDSIAADLQTLEVDAAPADWKCLWNRGKSQYCYVHQRNGDVRWNYPLDAHKDSDSATTASAAATHQTPIQPTPSSTTNSAATAAGVRCDDDEMDICLTPPPSADVPCPKPLWKKEPLPPGTDATESLSITSELASFYSDLAAIESTPATDETAADAEVAADASSAGATSGTDLLGAAGDDALKEARKKKRKIRKMQPWRSGNLETWINKWAKAQQELEN